MKKAFLCFIFIISNFTFSQNDIDYKNMIGTACFESGQQSEKITLFSKLLKNKKHKEIADRLNSKNASERFLAAFILDKLHSLNKITLTFLDLQRINKVKKSSDLIQICSGCTYFEKVHTNILFEKNKDNFMLVNLNYWIDYYMK